MARCDLHRPRGREDELRRDEARHSRAHPRILQERTQGERSVPRSPRCRTSANSPPLARPRCTGRTSLTAMAKFCDERIATCPVHRLRFNCEEATCADCSYAERMRPLPPALAPRRWAGLMKFVCPFCGGKSIRKESCSSWSCVRAYRNQHMPCNRCVNCGSRTKYSPCCTRYACRQVAGTRNMYYRRMR